MYSHGYTCIMHDVGDSHESKITYFAAMVKIAAPMCPHSGHKLKIRPRLPVIYVGNLPTMDEI